MEVSIHSPVSHEVLIGLAVKLREGLLNCEDMFCSSREFAELIDSAGALVLAITEPDEFVLSGS